MPGAQHQAGFARVALHYIHLVRVSGQHVKQAARVRFPYWREMVRGGGGGGQWRGGMGEELGQSALKRTGDKNGKRVARENEAFKNICECLRLSIHYLLCL